MLEKYETVVFLDEMLHQMIYEVSYCSRNCAVSAGKLSSRVEKYIQKMFEVTCKWPSHVRIPLLILTNGWAVIYRLFTTTMKRVKLNEIRLGWPKSNHQEFLQVYSNTMNEDIRFFALRESDSAGFIMPHPRLSLRVFRHTSLAFLRLSVCMTFKEGNSREFHSYSYKYNYM
ncbi:unnamed protein product [Allacma fusca]|uniref:Uncharacterized protein n=1 Tax=Allacma fusca TaxID=39272 RepID=A0A8J2L8B1_9HEXA|nr:unnamed protein product [Allacma fusca]